MSRFILALTMWLVFTVFFGSSGLLAQGIYYRPLGNSLHDVMNAVLREGDLLVISTVLSADALGRLFKHVFCHLVENDRQPDPWWSLSGLIISIVTFFVTAVYYASSFALRTTPNTEVSTLVDDSLTWFLPTLLGAICLIVATEFSPKRAV